MHQLVGLETYDFLQVFGANNEELKSYAKSVVCHVSDDGLLWLCYPKHSSKAYKESDYSRETVLGMLSEEDYEPVRNSVIDDDWSAFRFRKPMKIRNGSYLCCYK